jgi:hypothetical protein
MKRLHDIVSESLLDGEDEIMDKAYGSIKMSNALAIVKKFFSIKGDISVSRIKYNKKFDCNGKLLEVGDLVMYGYSTGGFDGFQLIRIGVVIGFEATSYGSKVVLNISGDKEKPITTKEYCGAVMKVTPNMVKNLYK